MKFNHIGIVFLCILENDFSVALILLAFQTQGQLFINELMSNNQSTIQDADGDYFDWIELLQCRVRFL
ncbi:MAG: hypothetical protein IPQ03_13255 [Bacteroidetes bacterium]|nr:hypothetical protein [Bacteroidota bacterium]